jgi:hypothetical protein
MRRMLIGVTLAAIALTAALWLSRPEPPSALPLRIDLGKMNVQVDTEWWGSIDPEISIVDCRIVAKQRLNDDRFLLTEECRWKGGGIERRRFFAFRKGDGPSQGWMYRLAESDV